MSDFKPLDGDRAALVKRWLHWERKLFAARVALAQATARAAVAQRLERLLDPSNNSTPADRAMLLRRRADAIEAGKRAVTDWQIARTRLSALADIRRGG